jgi:hypothetical protein
LARVRFGCHHSPVLVVGMRAICSSDRTHLQKQMLSGHGLVVGVCVAQVVGDYKRAIIRPIRGCAAHLLTSYDRLIHNILPIHIMAKNNTLIARLMSNAVTVFGIKQNLNQFIVHDYLCVLFTSSVIFLLPEVLSFKLLNPPAPARRIA